MKIVILNYNAGNSQSILFALQRLGSEAKLSADPQDLLCADKLIFPGVGQARSAMDSLRRTGLDRIIPQLKIPVLGICLGMQLLCNYSEEGATEGLGVFAQDVKRLDSRCKVPHMGWNTLISPRGRLFEGVEAPAWVYFVHSYYLACSECTTAIVDYGGAFCAALERDNFFGVQFHPEKSAAVGELILRNFIKL